MGGIWKRVRDTTEEALLSIEASLTVWKLGSEKEGASQDGQRNSEGGGGTRRGMFSEGMMNGVEFCREVG